MHLLLHVRTSSLYDAHYYCYGSHSTCYDIYINANWFLVESLSGKTFNRKQCTGEKVEKSSMRRDGKCKWQRKMG